LLRRRIGHKRDHGPAHAVVDVDCVAEDARAAIVYRRVPVEGDEGVVGGAEGAEEAVDGAGFMAESCPSLAFEAGTLVAGNVASFRGGGLYAVGTAVTITGDSALDDGFLANEATFGGGVCYEPDAGQALEAVNADFGVFEDDNIASGEGRDIYNLGVAASYGDGATFVCDSSGGCY
jgi:hypothetical protein